MNATHFIKTWLLKLSLLLFLAIRDSYDGALSGVPYSFCLLFELLVGFHVFVCRFDHILSWLLIFKSTFRRLLSQLALCVLDGFGGRWWRVHCLVLSIGPSQDPVLSSFKRRNKVEIPLLDELMIRPCSTFTALLLHPVREVKRNLGFASIMRLKSVHHSCSWVAIRFVHSIEPRWPRTRCTWQTGMHHTTTWKANLVHLALRYRHRRFYSV